MNCLVIDGPGQGKSLLIKIWVSDETYVRAGKSVIDYLVKRPEVHANKISIHGINMGSYWASLIGAHESIVKAISPHACNWCNKDHIFDETSPNLKIEVYMDGRKSERRGVG